MERTGKRQSSSKSSRRPAAKKRAGDGGFIIVREYDGVIFATVVILLLFGVVMIFSASYYTAMRANQSMFQYFSKQALAAVIGVCAMVIMASINYRMLAKLTPLLYVVSNILLVVTKYFGTLSHGVRRWLKIPIFGSFQPSEFAKLAVILFLAFFICKKKDRLKTFTGFAGALIIVGIPCALAYFCTSSLSSALTIAALGFGMIFVASPYFWRFIAMIGVAVGAMVTYLSIPALSSFRSARFTVWKDPFSDPTKYGFQTIQSLYAVASGGLFGLGLGNSNQKLIYLPEPHNDFIFAIICEELGFFGAGVILLLFSVLIWRGIRVALNSPDLLGTLIATGIVVMIAVQVIINVGVVTNTIPNTGIPLPFISYGGTSVVFIMALMGILLNISRYSKA